MKKAVFLFVFLGVLWGAKKLTRTVGKVVDELSPGKVVVDCSFGSGDGEVGCIIPEGEIPTGPCDFKIDGEGNIYICDGVNNRIVVFDSNGNFLRNLSIGRPGIISVDLKGNIYTLKTKKVENGRLKTFIRKYSPYGELLKEVELCDYPPRGPLPVFFPQLDYRGRVYLWEGGRLVIFDEDLNRIKDTLWLNPDFYTHHWSGWRVPSREELKKTKEEVITLITPQGKRISIPAPKEWKTPFSKDCSIEGVDRFGNVYVWICGWKFAHPRIPSRILKFSPTGEFLGYIQFISTATADICHGLTISPDGDVYRANLFVLSADLKVVVPPGGDPHVTGIDRNHYWIVKYPAELFEKSLKGGE